MIKAGSLRHYAASLLQLYYVCRGPLKHSIFIDNAGLYTYTHIPSKCVCVGVLWQLKKTFRFSLHAGAIEGSHNGELAAYISAVPATGRLQTNTACSFNYILNSKKGYIILMVCMYVLINLDDNWKHGAEDPLECVLR